jgi:hypothetical protein
MITLSIIGVLTFALALFALVATGSVALDRHNATIKVALEHLDTAIGELGERDESGNIDVNKHLIALAEIRAAAKALETLELKRREKR